MVDIKLEKIFDEPLPMDLLKEQKPLKDMMLLQRGMRLSVQLVTASEWKTVLALASKVARG